ncbi:MAG: KpsF/GutQ family sugar-phosphate isomerase [Melioribacteraceae bacterium]|nr:KpsF/GutQ family sugar-phosphate isomerase [Melioribacteraceae bacterium]
MSEEQIIAVGKRVIEVEAKSVQDLSEKIDASFASAVNAIISAKGRVIISGLGKSGIIARKIVATLNSTGTPSISLHPTDALHGDLGMVRSDDIVILISKSGTTEELINVATMVKRLDVLIIGMIGMENSSLGELCDIILNIHVTEEACPYDLAPTSSTTAMLAMGDALAIALLEERGFTAEDFAELHPGGSLGKRLSLRISEIMYKDKSLPVVNESAKINEIIYEISSKRLGTTSVVDDKGELVGIITDGDLRRLLEKTLDIKNIVAKDLMSKNPKTISKDMLASFALQQMENYNITSLIISQNKKPVGIVHLHDLVKLGLRRR